MKKCPHGGEVLGLELTDFDLRTAIENALILVRDAEITLLLDGERGREEAESPSRSMGASVVQAVGV